MSMADYFAMGRTQLEAERQRLLAEYEGFKAQGLKLDMSRGKPCPEQLDLFTDYSVLEQEEKARQAEQEKERRMQQTMMSIKKKFGKNAILKGMSLEEGATARERNAQIGGPKAGQTLARTFGIFPPMFPPPGRRGPGRTGRRSSRPLRLLWARMPPWTKPPARPKNS